METHHILIADDEQEARELILYYLSCSALSYTITEATDGRSALQLLDSVKPDILFLDIKMPEMSGIEVLEHRNDSPLPAIIFTTAFDEYALPAFEFEATDYLLKPFEKQRFDKALEKAVGYIKYIKFVNSGNKRTWLKQLPVKNGTKTELIPVDEIEFFQSDGAYIQVNTKEKSWLLNNPLYEMESKLDPAGFIRIHKSTIVNISSVKEINSIQNGDFIIKLKTGKELRGSRNYKTRVKEHIKFK
jgi:two-component system LytT family response regulator